MDEVYVSIGEVKRDLSDLVNRVAYRGERIVLTSRGRPKAALVSIEEYEQLKRARNASDAERWAAWLAESKALANGILQRRAGEPLDIETLWQSARADLEERGGDVGGH